VTFKREECGQLRQVSVSARLSVTKEGKEWWVIDFDGKTMVHKYPEILHVIFRAKMKREGWEEVSSWRS
jgi:hypothetical protein